MRSKHPFPCFSGLISLDVLYSLKRVNEALEDLMDLGLVHRLTDDEKRSARCRIEFDLYVLTPEGYASSSREYIQK